MDFQSVKDRVWKYIWVISAKQIVGGQNLSSGVAFNPNRIMTCAHAIDSSTSFVVGRMLHESGFNHQLRTVYVRPNSDLRILECVNGEPDGFEWGALSFNEKLSMSEHVFAMGNPTPYPGSFLTGKVSYRCKKITDFSFLLDSRICLEYYHDCKQILDYRYAGQHLNKYVSFPMTKTGRIQHPMLPIIQCVNINSSGGLSGGPLFKLNGDIIGIVVRGRPGLDFDIAVHVSAIKALIAEAEANLPNGMRYPESTTFDGSEWLETAPT